MFNLHPYFTGSDQENVAFSVHLLGDKHIIWPAGTVVVYDQILSNSGNGYNKDSGIFTVPTAGTYFFNMYCMSYKPLYAALGIFVNNEVQCTSYGNTNYGVGTCSIIKDLNVGDVVSVKTLSYYTAGAHLYGDPTAGHKHTNGFVGLLYKTR